jgi:phosphate transport system permease protein
MINCIILSLMRFVHRAIQLIKRYWNWLKEKFMAVITWSAAILTIGLLAFIVVFILVKGIPYIKLSLFSLTYNSENVSLMPALITTVIMTAMSLVIAVPLGVFAAIYMVEYAKRGNKAVALVRITTETLSGIPSIVYGLFGMLFFVTFLGWRFSMLAGASTLAIMILPLIMRSSEEALKAVPDTYREGAFGLGAGKLRTVFKIVLPSAMPGILAGIILAVGRIVGETAALIYTAGTVAQIPVSPMQSARTLSVHMYALSSEGLHTNESYATAVVLLLVVIIINMISAKVAKHIGREV